MKKIVTLILVLILGLFAVLPVSAEDGKVSYNGKAKDFIFEPGSEYSPTDLFPNFKGVMPGDVLTQQILVKNNADKKVKVKLYVRSLGAHKDSQEFLSKLGLKVQKNKKDKMAYMFDAAANESAQLTDWVYLGTLYSGGEVGLELTLSVPVELDNEFKNQIGYLDWEFKVEEFPAEDGDPEPPKTGDTTNMLLWAIMMAVSGLMIIILLIKRRKDKKEEETAQI